LPKKEVLVTGKTKNRKSTKNEQVYCVCFTVGAGQCRTLPRFVKIVERKKAMLETNRFLLSVTVILLEQVDDSLPIYRVARSPQFAPGFGGFGGGLQASQSAAGASAQTQTINQGGLGGFGAPGFGGLGGGFGASSSQAGASAQTQTLNSEFL
jgi:hypothetical protein